MLLADEQRPLDTEIGQELMLVMPEGWTEATLVAEKSDLGGGSESYRLTIVPGKGQHGVALVSDDLQAAIRKLFLLHKKYSTGLSLARYIVKNTSGNWSLVSEYSY